ncbi:MAG: hydroxymyristoyl-ACP dehydratase [Paludibacteraceae bacterium]|nr:hydroxymyristoyl-ACP dehydratase [Paludibacteraceae bacterium]
MKALYEGEGIKKLLPQREPIIMVDRYYGIEDEVSYSALTVKEDNIFCQNGCMRESGMVEHMAQSAAAYIGYNDLKSGNPISLGFIGTIDDLQINFLPKVGQKLETKVFTLQVVMVVILVKIETYVDGQLAASCKMKVYQKKD